MHGEGCGVSHSGHTRDVVGGTDRNNTMSNSNNPLNALPVSTLKVIAKLADDAVKGRREEFGQVKGEFSVDQTVVLRATGTVSVSKSSPNAIIAQKAKPWALLAVALEEANRQLEAAGKAGIDLERVVELAESADPDLAKEAEKKAKAHLKEIKEEVRGFRWGGVSVDGKVEVVAKEDHRDRAAG